MPPPAPVIHKTPRPSMFRPGSKPLTKTYSSSGMGMLSLLLKDTLASTVKVASLISPSTPKAQSLMVLTEMVPSISGRPEI